MVKKSNSYFLEEFYVLKSNRDIKSGEYKKYIKSNSSNKIGNVLVEEGNFKNNEWKFYNTSSENNELIMKGEYENGLKIGNWSYFNSKTGNMNKGKYKDGNKIGKWTYMYHNQISQIYDYTLDSAIYTIEDTLKYLILQNKDTIIDKLDRVTQ